jgi:hypothetical protein
MSTGDLSCVEAHQHRLHRQQYQKQRKHLQPQMVQVKHKQTVTSVVVLQLVVKAVALFLQVHVV